MLDHPPSALHRPRAEILKAQHRLGHRDHSTTLRNYAHAMPLEDQAVADAIDTLLASPLKNGPI